MSFIKPEDVVSPKTQWRLLKVLWSSGDDGAALALGLWDGEPALGMRWNGKSRTSGVGNPQSRGLPTWFIVPEPFVEPVLSFAKLDATKVALARQWFELHSDNSAA